jgi:hypothetical protein
MQPMPPPPFPHTLCHVAELVVLQARVHHSTSNGLSFLPGRTFTTVGLDWHSVPSQPLHFLEFDRLSHPRRSSAYYCACTVDLGATSSAEMSGAMKRPISVCICGGGNAAHVLAADLGARPKDFVVSLFAGFADEAEKVSMRTIITLHCLNAALMPLAPHSRCSHALGSPLALFAYPWLATHAAMMPFGTPLTQSHHSRCCDTLQHTTHAAMSPLAHH